MTIKMALSIQTLPYYMGLLADKEKFLKFGTNRKSS